MSKKNEQRKQVPKQSSSKGTNNTLNEISKKEMIELLAEAQYKAMKRFEQEKKEQALKEEDLKKHAIKERHQQSSKREVVMSNLKLILFPGMTHKKGEVVNIADDLMSTFISFVWLAIGHALRVLTVIATFFITYVFIKDAWYTDGTMILTTISLIALAVLGFMIGTLFVFVSKDLEKEKDKNYIMSHTSTFFAILAIILSIVLTAK